MVDVCIWVEVIVAATTCQTPMDTSVRLDRITVAEIASITTHFVFFPRYGLPPTYWDSGWCHEVDAEQSTVLANVCEWIKRYWTNGVINGIIDTDRCIVGK